MTLSNYQEVQYRVLNGVATITLDRPDATNSLTRQMRNEISELISKSSMDDSVRIIVIEGSGRAFCAGQNLEEGAPPGEPTKTLLEEEYKPLIMAIDQCDKIVIASINGACAGVGTALALACDLVVMADDAYMYQAFIAIGLVPDGGACWQLVQQLGYRKALELAIEGDKIQATTCMKLGLANRVVAKEELQLETQNWAEKLAKQAPLAVTATKKAMKNAQGLNLADTIMMEAEVQGRMTETNDAQEAVKAFLEKRTPVFEGR